VAGCWRLLAAADAAASSPSHPQLLMQQPAAAGWSWLLLAGARWGCWLLHQQQPAAASSQPRLILSSRVTFCVTNNFGPNPVFA